MKKKARFRRAFFYVRALLTRVAFRRNPGFRRNPHSRVGNGNDTNG